MNIHEHQAKDLLRNYGAPVSSGVVIFKKEEIDKKISQLKGDKFVVKAQIHAGGRGKAGGVKLVKGKKNLKEETAKMFGKILVTHQTGPEGKEVKRLYIEEASEISKELYRDIDIHYQHGDSSNLKEITKWKPEIDIGQTLEDLLNYWLKKIN